MGELNYKHVPKAEVFRANIDAATLNVNGSNNAATVGVGITAPITVDKINGATAVGPQLTLPSGTYHVVISANTQSTNQRVSHAIRLLIGGVVYSVSEPSDYKRVLGGHSRGSTVYSDVIDLANTDTLDFDFLQRSGGTGGLTSLLPSSRIMVIKL